MPPFFVYNIVATTNKIQKGFHYYEHYTLLTTNNSISLSTKLLVNFFYLSFHPSQTVGLANDDAVSKEFRPYKQMIECLNRTSFVLLLYFMPSLLPAIIPGSHSTAVSNAFLKGGKYRQSESKIKKSSHRYPNQIWHLITAKTLYHYKLDHSNHCGGQTAKNRCSKA